MYDGWQWSPIIEADREKDHAELAPRPLEGQALTVSAGAEIIDALSHHVQDQVFAFTGGPVAPVPTHSTVTDLLEQFRLRRGHIRSS